MNKEENLNDHKLEGDMKWMVIQQGWRQNAQLRWCKQLQRGSGEDLLLKASERKVLLGWKDLRRVGNLDIRKHPKNSLIHGIDTTRLDKYYMSLWITESLQRVITFSSLTPEDSTASAELELNRANFHQLSEIPGMDHLNNSRLSISAVQVGTHLLVRPAMISRWSSYILA